MADDQPNIPQLFAQALELPVEQRGAFVDECCASSPAAHRELLALLRCLSEAGDFLEEPVVMAPAGALFLDEDHVPMPERIGEFKITGILGAGGMGIVYKARSEKPARDVALKVIRPHLVSTSMLRRFEFEAQVLAVLQHPGIAQIYQAGAAETSSGAAPYFAMELVEGPPIAAFCASNNLTIRDRLDLVARVCDAVHHAHQRGVIHRDLKPANILIAPPDQPKVLDFGVARLTSSSTATVNTVAGSLVGTLAYMSPEQVAGDPLAVDVRSDVYALGVILFEILTGHPPYDLSRVSITEALRIIRDAPPPALAPISPSLRGDPELIVHKAMAKDPHLRYASASELAADLRRYLSCSPITARRPSAVYHLRTFARRNKTLVAVAGLALAGVTAGGVTAVWQASRAAEEARVSDLVADYLGHLYESASPNSAGEKRRTFTVVDALDRSTVEALRAQFPTEYRARVKLHSAIGNAYESIDELEKAQSHYTELLALCREHFRPGSREMVDALNHQSQILRSRDQLDASEALAQEAVETATRSLGPDDEDTINSRNNLAVVHLRRGEAGKAEVLFRASMDSCRRKYPPASPLTLQTMNNLASALKAGAKLDQAVLIRREILTTAREAQGNDNINTVTAINNLAKDLLDAGNPTEAEPLLREAYALRLKLQGPKSRSTLNTMANLGTTLGALGKLEEAEKLLHDAAEGILSLTPESKIDSGRVQRDYGLLLLKRRRFEDAERTLLASHAAFSAALGPSHKQTQQTAKALADLYDQWNRPDDASRWRAPTSP